MQPRDLASLADILEAARLVVSFVQGVNKDAFDNNLMMQSAVIRQMEIMGEATKRLSEGFRVEHQGIPWKNIAGMRDILIHAYDHVDPDEVWNAVQRAIPDLIRQIEALLPEDRS